MLNPIVPSLGFPCPLELTCTVTGGKVTYTDPAYIKGRIEKAGGLVQLMSTFVSKAGRSQRAAAKPAPTRMWKGQSILGDTTSTTKAQPALESGDGKLVERLFTFADGHHCRVVTRSYV